MTRKRMGVEGYILNESCRLVLGRMCHIIDSYVALAELDYHDGHGHDYYTLLEAWNE